MARMNDCEVNILSKSFSTLVDSGKTYFFIYVLSNGKLPHERIAITIILL